MIEAVIFDMDGVLINSVESAYRVKSNVLAGYGVDMATVPDSQNENHKGGSLTTLLSAVQEHTGLSIDEPEFSKKVVDGIYDDLKQNNVSADPALVNFLTELKDNNVPLAIATSASAESTDNKLRILGIKSFFQAIITTDDVKEHKPHPESYLTAIKRLGADAAKSVIFEDSLAGVNSAIAARAIAIGVTIHIAKKEPLPGTVTTIDDWAEINYERLEQLVDSA